MGGAFIGVPAEQRTNAAREGSGARPLCCRSPTEPQRPWEPGSARVLGDGRARGGARASGSCRPYRVAGLSSVTKRRAMREASMWPGLLGQHAAASRLHRAAYRYLPAYDRARSDFLLQTLIGLPPPSFPSFPGFLRVSGDQDNPEKRRPSSEYGESPQSQGAASPTAPLGKSSAASAPGATSPTSRGPQACAPSLCRRQGRGCQPAVP